MFISVGFRERKPNVCYHQWLWELSCTKKQLSHSQPIGTTRVTVSVLNISHSISTRPITPTHTHTHTHTCSTNLDAQRQSRAHDLVEESHDQEEPSQLVEPVAHYSSPPRGLNIRGTRSIVPSPSTATSHHSLTPNALRPSSRAAEAIQLREEALRLQEEREEDTLRARRKVHGIALIDINYELQHIENKWMVQQYI